MGEDDDVEDSETSVDPPTPPKVISTDLSHMYNLEGRPRVASLELQGFLGTTEAFILVDTGSTHNFVHPDIAEKSNLPLTAVRPFRVYVGNDQSLLCSHMSAKAKLRIQGHHFSMDLYILPIHGPDVILGMLWLRSLHRVTSDYDEGTLEFDMGGRPIRLRIIHACRAEYPFVHSLPLCFTMTAPNCSNSYLYLSPSPTPAQPPTSPRTSPPSSVMCYCSMRRFSKYPRACLHLGLSIIVSTYYPTRSE